MTDRAPKRPPEPQAKRVGLWIRVSTEDQARGESPKHHEHRARAYAESKGWEVVKLYDLSGVSGKTVINHREAQAMLKDVREKRIEALVFSKIARLARNTTELLEIADIFKEYGADLVSLDEAIDTSTPGGRFFYTILAASAHWEREEISARAAASVPIRAKLGKSLGGIAPFGYRWEDRKLVPDPAEAPVRKLLFELFLDLRRVKAVSRTMNERGYRMRDGAKFSSQTVKRLLEDPVAKGVRRTNFTTHRGPGEGPRPKPESEWVFVQVPPIVSEETFDAVSLILAERKTGKRPPGRLPVHIFAGYLFCGACDRKMYVPKNSVKYDCATCHRKIPIDDLEAIFHGQLRSFFFDERAIADYLDSGEGILQEKRALLEALTEERRTLSVEMDKLYRLYLDDGITVESFRRRNSPLEERASALEIELPTLQAEIDSLAIAKFSAEEVVAEGRDLYSRWSDFSLEEKRTIIETVVDRIEVGEGEVTISFNYLPVPPSPPTPETPPQPSQKGHTPSGGRRCSAPGTAWPAGDSGPGGPPACLRRKKASRPAGILAYSAESS
jgi:site-specific DNA recombinase